MSIICAENDENEKAILNHAAPGAMGKVWMPPSILKNFPAVFRDSAHGAYLELFPSSSLFILIADVDIVLVACGVGALCVDADESIALLVGQFFVLRTFPDVGEQLEQTANGVAPWWSRGSPDRY